ncbi:MAG: hypothetical protein GX540_03490 [Clostridiales bacterium]|nr:hypothetical protein [Clostridiales bacterium]
MEDMNQKLQELEQGLEKLAQRESELALKERAMKAREALGEAGLPQHLAEHLNLSSDEALDQSLALAREIRKLPFEAGPGTPRAGMARLPQNAGYAQRALLYQTDREAYYQQFGGETK